MEYNYKIKVTSVDYYVDWEDIDSNYEVPEDLDDEDLEEWYEIKIDEIKHSLPQELELEIEAEPEDLEDIIADTVSEETGWLNNSFTYEIISKKKV